MKDFLDVIIHEVEVLEPEPEAVLKVSICDGRPAFKYIVDAGQKRPEGVKIVYALLCEHSKRVKIGVTDNLRERVKQIQAMSPNQLKLVASFHCDGFEFESWLHRRLSRSRLHGEWFEWDEDVTQVVDALVKNYKASQAMSELNRWAYGMPS